MYIKLEQNQQETGTNEEFHQNEQDGMQADRQIGMLFANVASYECFILTYLRSS